MLPLPGAPSTSWAMYRQRLQSAFHGADLRVCVAFWFFGLINNVLYVIILTAALDLVGPTVPKGLVLLADVIPSFTVKLLGPYFVHAVPYPVRVLVFCLLSAVGMLLVALTPAYTDGGSISLKMAGVVLASAASGGGELSFLSLTHYYGPFSLAAWGSGTGAAGLVGAGVYALATTVLGLPVRGTLLASAALPAVMLVSFFGVLPMGPLKTGERAQSPSAARSLLGQDREEQGWSGTANEDSGGGGGGGNDDAEVEVDADDHEDGSLANSRSLLRPKGKVATRPWTEVLKANLALSKGLFFPFMLPLLLVYIAEYTINLGLFPTLLFPLASSPFASYRAFYPTYNLIYQSGVFLSRSSTPFVRLHRLYPPSLLQVLNLVFLAAHALFDFLPSVWFVLAVVFWEGLLGGAVYVNTFAEILDTVPAGGGEREFSLGAVSVSDSGGVCVAGFLAMAIEVAVCGWQVEHGRDYCRRL